MYEAAIFRQGETVILVRRETQEPYSHLALCLGPVSQAQIREQSMGPS